MPVYSHRMMSDLTHSLNSMAEMFFSRMPLVLDPDEFIAAFIAPEHRDVLREVEELVGFVGHTASTMPLPTPVDNPFEATVTFGYRVPIILPRYVSSGVQPTCPEHVLEKIVSWTGDRLRFGYAFGDAHDALVELNDICADVRAISAMLPCFPTIMGSISDDEEAKTNKRARTLTQSKQVGRLPRLPREVKDRLLEVSAIVNSVSLMKDSPVPETPKYHARFQRGSYNTGAPRRPHIFDVDKPLQKGRDATFI